MSVPVSMRKVVQTETGMVLKNNGRFADILSNRVIWKQEPTN